MREIVDTELHLEPVRGCLAPRNGHYPGIVDEQMEGWMPIGETPGEIAYGREICKIAALVLDFCRGALLANFHDGLIALRVVAAGEHNLCPGCVYRELDPDVLVMKSAEDRA